MRQITVGRLAGLLFCSGLCALIYQVVWLRELRLVFGSSTAATGMVLAVFMGGLGFGALYLGRLADRRQNPLVLYGLLELGITACAALSPLLILLVRKLYLAMGGFLAMGLPLATLVRILLSATVLLAPTFMMGGTLPAVARSAEADDDAGRRDLAILYGFNTLGGVLGTALATFYFLELLGDQTTLWLACLVNGLVGGAALLLARNQNPRAVTPAQISLAATEPDDSPENLAVVPMAAVQGAAFITGFVFLLMELVWYRMLTPLLGGSTFTFGLILATALAGIGAGGTFFGLREKKVRTTLSAFALTCSLEALCIVIPLALGDRLALFAALLKPLAAGGFPSQVLGWSLLAGIVVLPAAILSGIQFPMLVGLLGQGGRDIGRHTGMVYGWNTVGAIAGSLAGGFGLLPLLSAPGCWRLVVFLLLILALGSALLGYRHSARLMRQVPVAVVMLSALGLLLTAEGPSAVWRHSAIGATHYVDLADMNPNQIREWQNGIRREILWEKEGIESSIAMKAHDGLAFIVNGKPDGHAIGDAGMQVMGPLIGPILHPAPKRGLVIGLGTGSSAGWLAEVPTMERVDVAEIEPAILEVARWCSPVNFSVLNHPKVRVLLGDGRELVQTVSEHYDIILSEPSNPYRAGIASLYTRDFYQSVRERLAPGGYFSQWVQGYYIDGRTVRTIIATLSSVFTKVEIWITNDSDLLFVCTMEELPYSVPLLRQKVATEPFRSALYKVWGVSGLEGFLGAYLGKAEASREIARLAASDGLINSDDRMVVEFDFARTAGRTGLFSTDELRQAIRKRNFHRPDLEGGEVDWEAADENFFRIMLWSGKKISTEMGYSREQVLRWHTYEAYSDNNFQAILSAWQEGILVQQNPLENAMLAEALADTGDERSVEMAEGIRGIWPAASDGIMARYLWRKGDQEKAYEFLAKAIQDFRENPWQIKGVVAHSLTLAMEMAGSGLHGHDIFALLNEPFSVYQFEEYRKFALVQTGKTLDHLHGAEALAQWEPAVPWQEPLLAYRLACYNAIGSPLTVKAAEDLERYRAARSEDVFASSKGHKEKQ